MKTDNTRKEFFAPSNPLKSQDPIFKFMDLCDVYNLPYKTKKDLEKTFYAIEIGGIKTSNNAIYNPQQSKGILTQKKAEEAYKLNELIRELNEDYNSTHNQKWWFTSIELKTISLETHYMRNSVKRIETITDLEKYIENCKNTKYGGDTFLLKHLNKKFFNNISKEEGRIILLKNFKPNNPELYKSLKKELKATQSLKEVKDLEDLTTYINTYKDTHDELVKPEFYFPYLTKEFFTENRLTPTDFLKTLDIQPTEGLLIRSPAFNELLMNQLKSTFEFMELADSFDLYLFNDKEPKSYLFNDKYPTKVNNNLGILLYNIINNRSAVVCYRTKGNIASESKDLDKLKQAIELNRELNRELNLFNEVNKHQSTKNDKPVTIENLIEKLENQIPLSTKITNAFASLFNDCCGLCR